MRITVETVATSKRRQQFAEVLFDGRYIDPAGDLLGHSDGEVVACGLEQPATLDLVLERFALSVSALEHGICVTKRVSERLVRQI